MVDRARLGEQNAAAVDGFGITFESGAEFTQPIIVEYSAKKSIAVLRSIT